VLRFLDSWWTEARFYRPDVNEGGFGIAARWLLLPFLAVVVADLVRGRRVRETLPIIGLAALSLAGPFTYVPRFAMGLSFAFMAAAAYVFATGAPLVRWLTSMALVVLLLVGYRRVTAEQAMEPGWERVVAMAGYSELEQATTPLVEYHWNAEVALAREQLPEGSVVVYDEGLEFVEEVFTHDYRTVARFVPSDDARHFVGRTQQLDARWVLVRPGPAEPLLRAVGGRLLFARPNPTLMIYEMPRAPAHR
jgi:hypothetical protein